MFKNGLLLLDVLKKLKKKNITSAAYAAVKRAIINFQQDLEAVHSIVNSIKSSLNTHQSVEHDLVGFNAYMVDLICHIQDMTDFIDLFTDSSSVVILQKINNQTESDDLLINTLRGIIEAFEKMGSDLNILLISSTVAQQEKNDLCIFAHNITQLKETLDGISHSTTLQTLQPILTSIKIDLVCIQTKLEEIQKKIVWRAMEVYVSVIYKNSNTPNDIDS